MQNGLRYAHLRAQCGKVVGRLVRLGQQDNLIGAQGDRTQHEVHADRRHVIDLYRNHPRRQTLAAPRGAGDEIAAGREIVEQQQGIAPARGAIRSQQGLHLFADIGHARISVGHSTRGADRGAGTAAHAKMWLDLDVIAVGADRLGGADINALAAAGDFRAAVSADLFLVGKEPRLLEFAHGLGEVRHRHCQFDRISSRCVVALGRLTHGEERRIGEIENQVEAVVAGGVLAIEVDGLDVAAGQDALAVGLALVQIDLVGKIDGVFRAGVNTGVAAHANFQIDGIFLLPGHIESAQITGERCYLAG